VHGAPVDDVAAGVDGDVVLVVEEGVLELVLGLGVADPQQQPIVLDVLDDEAAVVPAEGVGSGACHLEVVLGVLHALERLLVEEVDLLVLLQRPGVRLEVVVLYPDLGVEGCDYLGVVVLDLLEVGLGHVVCKLLDVRLVGFAEDGEFFFEGCEVALQGFGRHVHLESGLFEPFLYRTNLSGCCLVQFLYLLGLVGYEFLQLSPRLSTLLPHTLDILLQLSHVSFDLLHAIVVGCLLLPQLFLELLLPLPATLQLGVDMSDVLLDFFGLA